MRLALRVLAAAGALAVMAKHSASGEQRPHVPSHDSVPRHGAAEHGAGHAGQEQPSQAAPPSPHRQREREESEHRRAERRYWWWGTAVSAVAALATLAASAFAAFALYLSREAVIETRRQANTAQEALAATDRTWIKVLALTAPRLEVMDGAVFLRARLSVKNIGRSPAQHAYVRARLQADGSAIDEARDAEALCREAAAQGIPFVETLIFPDDDRTLTVDALADMRDIAKHWRDRIERDYQLSRSLFGETDLAEKSRAERLSYPVRVGFTLIGCVTYVIPTGRSYGQTALIYDLRRNCGLGPYGECSFEMEEEGTYEGDALVLREAIGGAFAR